MNTPWHPTRHARLRAAVGVGLLSCACAAGAQAPIDADCIATHSTTVAGTTPPPEQQSGSISFVNGGIGAPQAEAMRAIKSGYPLALTFAEHLEGKDAYTAMVTVDIRDGAGNRVLCVSDAGPMLFLRLPDGDYTVTARSYGGIEQTRQIKVRGDSHQDVTLIWQP
jgi:hypothetical protein